MTNHIQINDVAPRIRYDADGVQSAFTYPFAIFKATDLEVWLGETLQQGGYTVSGAGVSSGGTVLFAVPPAAGTRVTLRRRLALARTSDYQADGIIRAKTLNDELDYQVAAIQQVAEDVARAVKRAPTSASLADLTLPEPQAGRVLKWNDSGLGLVNSAGDPDDLVDQLANLQNAREQAQAAAAEAVAARDVARAAALSVSDPLARSNNLGDLADPSVARTNLSVYSRAQVDTAFANVQPLFDRLAFLEQNLALTVLRDQIDAGWSVLKMVAGFADEFEDESGIASKAGAIYDPVGDYYHNAGQRITGATPSMPLGGSAANINDNNIATIATCTPGNLSFTTGLWQRRVAVLDLGSTKALSMVEVKRLTGNGNALSLAYSSDNVTGAPLGGEFSATATPGDTLRSTSVSARWVALCLSNANNFDIDTISLADLNAYAAPADMTVVSAGTAATGFSTVNPPAEARLVVLHQAIGAVALNNDLIVEASRDNGATWTVGALTNAGAFDASTNILTATIALASQPAGTAMKWRVRTLNNKEQRLHGVWMQWR